MRKIFSLFIVLVVFGSVLTAQTSDETENLIYRLRIFSEINSTSWIHTQNAFDEAETMKADAILIHLNTYGGQVLLPTPSEHGFSTVKYRCMYSSTTMPQVPAP